MNSKAEARRRAVLEALARAMEPLIAARAKERQESGRGADGSGGRGKRKNLCQKSDKGFDTKKEAAALAGVSHPGATSQKSANLSKRKNLSQKSVEGLDQGSTPTPVGSGTPQHGGQGERTTDGEAHGQGQG